MKDEEKVLLLIILKAMKIIYILFLIVVFLLFFDVSRGYCFNKNTSWNMISGDGSNYCLYHNSIIDNNCSSNKKSIKILALGNSFTQDNLTYVPFILKNIASNLDLTLGITYYSGATIDMQLSVFNNDTPIEYDIFKSKNNKWTINKKQNLKSVLRKECWDIILLQQGSISQTEWRTFANYGKLLENIVNYVSKDDEGYVGHTVKIGYLMPQLRHNRMHKESFDILVKNVKNISKKYPIDCIFPCGTAIQNAWYTSLNKYGNKGYMTADGYHMQEGIGCLVGAYTSALKILELAGINNISILGETTRPDLRWVYDKNIPGKNPYNNTTVVGISDENCLIAQKCAIAAIKNPYKISKVQ